MTESWEEFLDEVFQYTVRITCDAGVELRWRDANGAGKVVAGIRTGRLPLRCERPLLPAPYTFRHSRVCGSLTLEGNDALDDALK